MSPLATPAFKLCAVGDTTLAFKLFAVGDTGLKTGWVRCRHGAGGAGRGGMVVSVQCYKSCSLAPKIVCLSVSILQLCSLYSLYREVLRKLILR